MGLSGVDDLWRPYISHNLRWEGTRGPKVVV